MAERGRKKMTTEEERSHSYPTWDDRLNGVSDASLRDIARALDSKIISVKNRKRFLQDEERKQNQSKDNPVLTTWPDENHPLPLTFFELPVQQAPLQSVARAFDSKINSVKNRIGFLLDEERKQNQSKDNPVFTTWPDENQPLPLTFFDPLNQQARLPSVVRALDSKINSVKNRIGFLQDEERKQKQSKDNPVLTTWPDENQPLPLTFFNPLNQQARLPSVACLDFGIQNPYLPWSEVGLGVLEMTHLPQATTDLGIQDIYRNVGSADMQHLPAAIDFQFGLQNVYATSKVGVAVPERNQNPLIADDQLDVDDLDLGFLQSIDTNLYLDELDMSIFDYSETNEVGVGVPESNQNPWIAANQMAVDDLDLGFLQNIDTNLYLDELDISIFDDSETNEVGLGVPESNQNPWIPVDDLDLGDELDMSNFIDPEIGPVSDQLCFNDPGSLNSSFYPASEDYPPSQNLLPPLPPMLSGFSYCNYQAPIRYDPIFLENI